MTESTVRPTETLLLLALPASGKSELRRYLASLSADTVAADFGLGPTVQLDDYPYVHLMRRISEEMQNLGAAPTFFSSTQQPFLDSRDWGPLMHLLNEDYAALASAEHPDPAGAAEWLIRRMDRARDLVGLPPVLAGVDPATRQALASSIEVDARQLWTDLKSNLIQGREGATVVIEFARGGPEGTTPPIPPPHGYQYSLGCLSAEILETASILYVWVTPEESRRRNVERAKPGRDGDASILHHGVPETVMRRDYGTDDLLWLVDRSNRPGAIRVSTDDGVFHLPVAVFDNRTDKTSFLRADPAAWPEDSVAELHDDLRAAFAQLNS